MNRQDLIFQVIRTTAESLGLPEGRVLSEGKDNLTVPRPRIEVRFVGETFTPAVKLIGATRMRTDKGMILELKKQLYTVREQAGLNVLAEDGDWLQAFCNRFVAMLPRGVNDADGNWVKIRAESAEERKAPEKRVGLSEIKVFNRLSKFLIVTFEGRITAVEQIGMIDGIEIKQPSYRQGA